MRCVVFLATMSIPLLLHAEDDWPTTPRWLGEFWQADPEFEKLLGVDSQETGGEYPARLHLAHFVNKEAAVAVMGEDALQPAESRFATMNHRLIAGGKWKAEEDFQGFAGKDPFFLVTTCDGATFLWFGTPQVTLKGAEVHCLHGVEPRHDLLVLDFGFSSSRGRLRAGNAVGYRRVMED